MNFNNLKNDEINIILSELRSEGTEIYVVGGAIRDEILNKTCFDRDYVICGEKAVEFAKKVAERIEGYFVLLDEEYDIARVVLQDKRNTLDFAGCFGKDIYEDIQRRDFTINSVACKISGSGCCLIDMVNGINDIKNGIIRANSEKNLIDDPLRLLRAFRFAAQLNFKIKEDTLEYIKKHKTLINNVSVERISTELIKFFESDHTAHNLDLMKETEFLDEILPELSPQRKVPPNLHHHLNLIDHSIETVRQTEKIIPTLPDWVKERLKADFTANIKIISLLKFSVLIHDIGKPETWQIDEEGRHRFIKHEEIGSEMAVSLLKRLKFSKNSIKYICKLIKYHMYPTQLLNSEYTEKAILRMFRRIEAETPEVIILAMADRLSARGSEITDEIIENNINSLKWLLDKYKESQEKVKSLPKLLNGEDVMVILEIKQSPEVGKILKALKEAQISGDINTKEEATAFIKGYATKNTKEFQG